MPLVNLRTGRTLAREVHLLETFWARFRGLMGRRRVPEDAVWLFVLPRASRLDAAIHMFFVFTPLGVLWLDDDGTVVDRRLARPWRPAYLPRRPARYIVEGSPELLQAVEVGDRLRW